MKISDLTRTVLYGLAASVVTIGTAYAIWFTIEVYP
jgi:hypothetical protein